MAHLKKWLSVISLTSHIPQTEVGLCSLGGMREKSNVCLLHLTESDVSYCLSYKFAHQSVWNNVIAAEVS